MHSCCPEPLEFDRITFYIQYVVYTNNINVLNNCRISTVHTRTTHTTALLP